MAMSKEESLIRLRQKKKTLKASLTRLENFFKDINPDNFDVDEIKVRIEKAEQIAKDLFEILLEISILDDKLPEADIEQELEESENKLLYVKLIEEKLVKSRVELTESNEHLEQTFQEANSNESNARRNAHGYNNFIRLPKIELPTFSGLYEECSLNDVQRFHYLKSALKGEAAECISALEISGLNYANAWTRKENGVAIRQILDGVLKHTRALQALKRPTQQWDDLLIHIIISKLDIVTIKKWENALELTVIPSFGELNAFLIKRCQTLEAIANQQQQMSVSTNSRKAGHNKVTVAHVATTNVKCVYCKGEHLIYQCKAFQKLSVIERTNQVKQKGLCLNCLRSKHLAKDCIAGNCKICGKKHSSLLHFENNDKQSKEKQFNPKRESDSSESKKSSDDVLCHYVKLGKNVIPKQVLLSTVIIKVRDKNGQPLEARALLDSGSQSNFISEKFVHKLGHKCDNTQIKINGINQQVSQALKMVNLSITSRFYSFTTDLKCVVLPYITQRAEKFWDFICVGQIKLEKYKPTLQKSVLGWIVSGVTEGYCGKVLQTSCHLSIDENLSDIVSKFWQVEDCLSQERFTEEELYVEEFFKNNYSRDAKDHTPLQTILWRENPEQPVKMFELLTVTYGTKSASFLATKCLHELATLEKEKFPIASKIVFTDFYMDDLLTGSDTVPDFVTGTNTKGPLVDFCKDQKSKLLGILWDPNEDVLYYKSPIVKSENKVTKRIMLAEMSRLFDPLELVGPVIIAAKILIQSLWAANVGWDDSVPMNIHNGV
ncbi:uncharacterized protein [Anoplolepis gracilipes]|uniref:uncharacterized protein n=1 Tax=Anoplolepis gracilipes TaxID=354296 RepID=UPI003B9F95D5